MYAFPYLSRIIGAEMFARLLAMMPPPPDASPEAKQDRDVFAMCMLKQMGPLGSAEEASLAITIVAADAHAHDALRGAAENAGDLKVVMQCRAQANAMMRTRHKAAAELEALMRSRMAAERLAADRESDADMADARETAPSVAVQPAVVPAAMTPAPVEENPEPVAPQAPRPVARVAPACLRAALPATNGSYIAVSEAPPLLPSVAAIVPPPRLAQAA